MAGLEKEARKVVNQAEKALKESSGSKKKSSGDKKNRGKSSGVDKAKRAAREFLR